MSSWAARTSVRSYTSGRRSWAVSYTLRPQLDQKISVVTVVIAKSSAFCLRKEMVFFSKLDCKCSGSF